MAISISQVSWVHAYIHTHAHKSLPFACVTGALDTKEMSHNSSRHEVPLTAQPVTTCHDAQERDTRPGMSGTGRRVRSKNTSHYDCLLPFVLLVSSKTASRLSKVKGMGVSPSLPDPGNPEQAK